MMSKECNNCPETVHIADDEIKEQLKRVRESGVPITDEGLYQRRLALCGGCDQLIYGTTCMSCGCLVRVRALNALRVCPHPGGSKW